MKAAVYDDRVCRLGEGPLWHPERQQLFWFDILGKRLLTRAGNQPHEWHFDDTVSAAGWIDTDTLLIASETALWRFDMTTGAQTPICPLEADNPKTRSNDGRADRWGGFWIGTMGKHAEPGLGAIYRYWRGELRKLVDTVTVSNAICFDPNTPSAYYTDTMTKQIMMQPLDPETGWPAGPARLHLDLTDDGLNPDGAVTDAQGQLWLAEWGSARVACYGADGARQETIGADALQTSCPAWGGPDFRDLFITSAAAGQKAQQIADHPDAGKTFVARGAGQGRPEPQVVL